MRLIRILSTVLTLSFVPAALAAQPHALPVLGMVGWTPMLMLVAGIVLLAVEVFVIPGFGWTGVLGLVATIGAVILALSPAPEDAALTTAMLVGSLTLLGIAAWAVASRLRAGHPLLGGLLSREEGYVAALPRTELEGLDGVALTDLRPSGVAQIGDERLDVVSETGWVPAGSPVRVQRSEGYRHVVRAIPLAAGAEEARDG
ncbi:NfeD family protein [Longimicrobium sp.]|uniref:NfeD family protein n=1 Tax=Longimicrobium sp. TaxID=2029185 RepID=UPI002E31C9C9|nr:NfeD family protein [Longimicrobium sp.]HEX6039629.1 NfeD family protein [Longimicrobium sp.]